MLTPLQVCEQLSVDEFIILCQFEKPHNFDILSIRRDRDHLPVIFVKLENGLRERVALSELYLNEVSNG